jgi:hypothetical protein
MPESQPDEKKTIGLVLQDDSLQAYYKLKDDCIDIPEFLRRALIKEAAALPKK